MQNIKLYTLFGVLGAIIMVAILRNIGASEMDKYGLTYKEVDKKAVVLNPQYYQVIGIKDENGTHHVYKAIDKSPRTGSMTYVHEAINAAKDEDAIEQMIKWNLDMGSYFVGEQPAETNFSFPLTELYQYELDERKTRFDSEQVILARSYVPPNMAADDWFTKIEDSALVAIPLAIIPFLILMLHDLLIFFLSNKKRDHITKGIQLVMITLAIGFFFAMLNPTNYAASRITQVILCCLVLYPLYFIFQRELPLIEKWDITHAWKEDYKFLIIFAGGCILIYLANGICRFIDTAMFNSDGYTILDLGSRMNLEMGLAFSFALGNLLNNIRKYIASWWRRSKKVKLSESKALASEAELNAMQASVNPHFLYNSLNSIASLAKSDPAKTEQMAIALSKFYKYNTNRDRSILSTVAEEIQLVKTYLQIEKIRFEERLEYTIQCSEQLEKIPLAHFLIQPLVENAIKYGYQKSSDKINIKINIAADQNDLMIQIFDKGDAFDEQLSSGYGLKSVMKKLEYLYPDRHSISFINEPEKNVEIIIQDIILVK